MSASVCLSVSEHISGSTCPNYRAKLLCIGLLSVAVAVSLYGGLPMCYVFGWITSCLPSKRDASRASTGPVENLLDEYQRFACVR